MEVVVRGRGAKVTPAERERIERRLSKLKRLNGRIERVDVEVITEPTPRVDGGHRVEASTHGGKRTFRATGTGTEFEAALERMADRLERQLADEHGRKRARLLGGANRIKSSGLMPPPELEG